MKFRVFGLVSTSVFGLAACTGPINSESTKDMPTGYLCRILDSNEYLSTPNEQRAIYSELERRDEVCVDNVHKIIHTQ